MRTRIEISDTLLENADSTIGFELEPPEPLRIVFSYGGAVTASYMDYGNGLFNIAKQDVRVIEWRDYQWSMVSHTHPFQATVPMIWIGGYKVCGNVHDNPELLERKP